MTTGNRTEDLFGRQINPVLIKTPLFGEPSLFAARNSDACWVRMQPVQVYQKGPTQWAANLYGGIQTNDDWASVVIPVEELLITELKSAEWTYFLTNAESAGVNIVVWVHDPTNLSKRAEITQLTGLTSKDANFNRETLSLTAAEMFYYGENVTDSNGNSPDTTITAGTNYTWAQFQEDSVFRTWTIYRITFDYGWLGGSTLEDAWVTEIIINGEQIQLKPDSGGSGRIGRRFYTTSSATWTGTLSPKTPYELLSVALFADAVLDTGEDFTLDVDAGRGAAYDTNIITEDLFVGSRTSYFATFQNRFLNADDDLNFAQANGSTDTLGLTITYRTVFP